MPGPTTEVLHDDVKELRSDFHQLELTLSGEIHKVDNAVAKLGAEFSVFKWLLGATLATTLSGVVGSAYWAGSLSSRVSSLEGRIDKIDARLDRIDTRLDQIDARLDRLELNVGRILQLAEKARAGDSAK